jgi:hypothetical protein
MVSRAGRTLAAVAGTALLASACGAHRGFAVRHDTSPSGIYEAAARHLLAESRGWVLRMDPRLMDSIPTVFDVERDVEEAPSPSFVPNDPHLSERVEVLASLGISQDRIEDYAACTRYMGGVPYTGPEARAEETQEERERRRACAARSGDAAAVLGLPRRATTDPRSEAWTVRAYILTPVSREVSDLIMVREATGWSVVRTIQVMRVVS